MAGIFGLDAKEAERGIPLSSLQAMIHPSDLASFERVQRDMAARGGTTVFEFRISGPDGGWRRILSRGRYQPIAPGQHIAPASGIVIDITDAEAGEDEQGGALVLTDSAHSQEGVGSTALDQAIDHAIGALEAVRAMGEQGAHLISGAWLLLHTLGRYASQNLLPDEIDEGPRDEHAREVDPTRRH